MSNSISINPDVAANSPDPKQVAIAFEHVSIAFEENEVLNDITFDVKNGETKVLLGVAGTGKTLLLKLALGLLRPDSGRIFTLGEEVTSMKEQDLFALRRRVGMVFQESALFDSLTVRENVAYPLREQGGIPDDEIEKRVREALRFVELEHTVDLFPSELSGGMRRRVAIARGMITHPDVVLYDSPTGGLDPVTSTTIVELIVKGRDVYKNTSIVVTHRLQDAFVMATNYFDQEANMMKPIKAGSNRNVHTNFVILRDTHVIFQGTASDLVASKDDYIREYLS
ncbi:ABC transporter, ATPase subunit [Candidatus Koribacter versatilis Ellin345]|uniref:ABC transporter, ATPase subunit n=1 Tax=Koribacter versatilis (strain Ellin345) TaxID=204669 RepID=Q1IMK8_KORVE|nr:ATP-binding cassette domain-containing protein [Candidatus Koribacter versatilis]ABF41892.1 ABC transporter, ATPase subunit [Candidatus Koribacter versatilis Ellin345]